MLWRLSGGVCVDEEKIRAGKLEKKQTNEATIPLGIT
jgi:hypothetical protein